jgi:urease accessory protein
MMPADPPAGAVTTTALLTLSQWLSPGFPIGSYAYSHGLEWHMAAGEVRDAPTLEVWLRDMLRFGGGHSDSILLANALRGEVDPSDLGDYARALAASAERARETCEQGAAFAAAVGAVTGVAGPALPYPVAVGVAARRLPLPPRLVVALYLQAFVANLVAAAVRFIPLGQTEGQRVLSALQPLVEEVSRDAVDAPLEAIGTAAIRSDLAAMRHETMSPRIFKT